MTDIIERAGRAALCGWNNVPRDNATMAAEWERMGPATREAWMRAMRAAIEAMREPSAESNTNALFRKGMGW